ncbi:MAG: hypothetical protein IPG44_01630 [Anaerolineales bacterium]|jgi:hypothetical protein|nr:hypothetical protein [Chloroflexota bacterium]MBK6644446.1 hypothetical protein [Anaerolineales bacterium]
MFDDLRNEASKQYDEESQAIYKPAANTIAASGGRSRKILGMTSIQRFIIVVMLLMTTCAVGFLCLFLTGRIGF